MAAHIAVAGHRLCGCGGYHYLHRPKSKYCDRHPFGAYHGLQRCTDDPADLEAACIDCSIEQPGAISWPVDPIPF